MFDSLQFTDTLTAATQQISKISIMYCNCSLAFQNNCIYCMLAVHLLLNISTVFSELIY